MGLGLRCFVWLLREGWIICGNLARWLCCSCGWGSRGSRSWNCPKEGPYRWLNWCICCLPYWRFVCWKSVVSWSRICWTPPASVPAPSPWMSLDPSLVSSPEGRTDCWTVSCLGCNFNWGSFHLCCNVSLSSSRILCSSFSCYSVFWVSWVMVWAVRSLSWMKRHDGSSNCDPFGPPRCDFLETGSKSYTVSVLAQGNPVPRYFCPTAKRHKDRPVGSSACGEARGRTCNRRRILCVPP